MTDQIPTFTYCPRCRSRAYEILRTHASCFECNYSPDLDPILSDPNSWLGAVTLTEEKKETEVAPDSNSDQPANTQEIENGYETRLSA